ncbi:hypothetical protein PINS_up022919 [Pythium insidiosum]|nr:hypothetical protein PINS_up022919 [Pythium insidiosum]
MTMRPRAIGSLTLFLALAMALTTALHTEEVRVRPLRNVHKALAHFHFATVDNASVYPLVLRQILTKYGVASLRLSFSRRQIQ